MGIAIYLDSRLAIFHLSDSALSESEFISSI